MRHVTHTSELSNSYLVAAFNIACEKISAQPGNPRIMRDIIRLGSEGLRRRDNLLAIERQMAAELDEPKPGDPGWWESCPEIEF